MSHDETLKNLGAKIELVSKDAKKQNEQAKVCMAIQGINESPNMESVQQRRKLQDPEEPIFIKEGCYPKRRAQDCHDSSKQWSI